MSTTFSERFQSLLAETGITQSAVARAAELSVANVNYLANGRHHPKLETAVWIAETLSEDVPKERLVWLLTGWEA